MRATVRSTAPWDAFLRRLYGSHSLDELAAVVLAEAPRRVGGIHTSFNALAPSVPRARIWMDTGDDPPRLERLFAAHMHEHPAVRNFLETGDPATHTISEFASARQLEATGLYQQLYRELGIWDQMGFCLGPPGRETFALAIGRERRSFAAADRRWMERLRPHLRQAVSQVRAFERLERRAEARERGIEALGHGLAVVDADGRLWEASPAAERLLEHFFGPPRGASPGALPEDLGRWLADGARRSAADSTGTGEPREAPWLVRRGGEALVIRARHDPDSGETTLLLERRTPPDAAQHLRARGLTPREVEVVLALEPGLRNAEIAAALGISPQTVRKHLENVYAKLGVQSRGAVVARLRQAPDPGP